jgi:predicted dehydrogenase
LATVGAADESGSDNLQTVNLKQHPDMPSRITPILSIGAGGIVRNAHYPAYRLAGFPVAAVYDINTQTAQSIAKDFEIPHVAPTLESLVAKATHDSIFDVAVPGNKVAEILAALPDESFVLIQKPLGETLDQAREIVKIVEEKNLHASVNFQLRWAPYSLAVKDLLEKGLLGEPHELEFKVCVETPWHLWGFLERAPRMEMIYHSIHYIDFARHLFGEPDTVIARSIKDPRYPNLESSRSTVVLDYGEWKRATIETYHGHVAGPKHQESYIRIEGPLGAAWVQMGLNMHYPEGAADKLEYWLNGDADWTSVPLEGSWFPHAFRGPIAAMMLWIETGVPPVTEVHDAFKTMALVDAAYRSSDLRGVRPDPV